MKAEIIKNGNYYTLKMDNSEMGGTNKTALAKYAKGQGYTEITYKDETLKQLKCQPFDLWR